jgi:hypothetical protein
MLFALSGLVCEIFLYGACPWDNCPAHTVLVLAVLDRRVEGPELKGRRLGFHSVASAWA